MSNAKTYLDRYWDGILPVNPKAIAHADGVEVVADDGLARSDLSGHYAVEAGAPTIRYSDVEPPVRQRFTIAHELGHHALGHGESFRDPIANFSLESYDLHEVAANRFAAELLMPAEAVEYLIRTTKEVTVAKLAKRFDVSQVAMLFRLKKLGWLNRG